MRSIETKKKTINMHLTLYIHVLNHSEKKNIIVIYSPLAASVVAVLVREETPAIVT